MDASEKWSIGKLSIIFVVNNMAVVIAEAYVTTIEAGTAVAPPLSGGSFGAEHTAGFISIAEP